MEKTYEILSLLLSEFGPSGREESVAEKISGLMAPYAKSVKRDVLGNLIVTTGRAGGRKVMLSAHMDTIGLIVTFIEDSGLLRFGYVGGVSKESLLNRPVRFENGVRGVVSYEEKTAINDLKASDFFIDIGAGDKKEAATRVKIGDMAVFFGQPMRNGEFISAPYLDNRAGCAVLIRAAQLLCSTPNEVFFVFSSQEEVGLRGATTAAFGIAPQIGVAVDVTDSGDVPGLKTKFAMKAGKGPCVKISDRGTICSPRMINALYDTAEKAGIPVQSDIIDSGSTDAGAIQKSRGGVLTGGLSIATRYIHSPCETASLRDMFDAARLLSRFVAGEISPSVPVE